METSIQVLQQVAIAAGRRLVHRLHVSDELDSGVVHLLVHHRPVHLLAEEEARWVPLGRGHTWAPPMRPYAYPVI